MRINENGRSMIEMLGVLAIIGVLSVGGIAGYSKAMAKFRANKTIDQVQHIVTNIRILFGSQKNYLDLGNGDKTTHDILDKANLLPDEMKTNPTANDMSAWTNPYAGAVTIKYALRFSNESVGASGAKDKAFTIKYDGIPQSACIDLASQDWNASSGTGLVAFSVNEDLANVALDTCASTNSNGKAMRCIQDMPMPVGHAVVACVAGSANYLMWKFY
ncbi:MAG: hypothetical protein IKN71_07860 [Alphaproteobacteria bacterium]|nr:hypothetical protein [Alphaproteobacteria bacterium]